MGNGSTLYNSGDLMLTLQETTEWKIPTPNHTYLTNDTRTKVLGYIRAGETKTVMFKTPIQWDTRGRTFTLVKREQVAEENVTVVEGSKGAKYFVTKTDTGTTCSCKGFQFRGQCRHTAAV